MVCVDLMYLWTAVPEHIKSYHEYDDDSTFIESITFYFVPMNTFLWIFEDKIPKTQMWYLLKEIIQKCRCTVCPEASKVRKNLQRLQFFSYGIDIYT